jgi:hypothetical protein
MSDKSNKQRFMQKMTPAQRDAVIFGAIEDVNPNKQLAIACLNAIYASGISRDNLGGYMGQVYFDYPPASSDSITIGGLAITYNNGTQAFDSAFIGPVSSTGDKGAEDAAEMFTEFINEEHDRDYDPLALVNLTNSGLVAVRARKVVTLYHIGMTPAAIVYSTPFASGVASLGSSGG